MNPKIPRKSCNTLTRDALHTPHFSFCPVVNISSGFSHYPIKVSHILSRSPRNYKPYISRSHNTSPIRSFQFKNSKLVRLPPLKPLLHVIRRKESSDRLDLDKRFHKRASSSAFIINGN